MTAALLWLAAGLAPWVLGAAGTTCGLLAYGIERERRHRAEHRARQLRAENRRLTNLVATVCEERDTAERAARDWAAIADEHAADQIEHQHRCLGVLVHENDGVKP